LGHNSNACREISRQAFGFQQENLLERGLPSGNFVPEQHIAEKRDQDVGCRSFGQYHIWFVEAVLMKRKRMKGSIVIWSFPQLSLEVVYPPAGSKINLNTCGDPDCGNFGVAADFSIPTFKGRNAAQRKLLASTTYRLWPVDATTTP